MNPLSKLLDTSDFPARWHCGLWTKAHGWTHIVSDVAIFGAYFAIPVAIASYVAKKRDVPFPRVFWLFAGFILSCGLGHLVEATLFWSPWYRLSAAVKVSTAVASWATVIALIQVLPTALRLPGLAKLNLELSREIETRKSAEQHAAARAAELQESEQRYRSIVDTAMDAVISLDASGKITGWNEQAAAIFGWAESEALGQPMAQLIMPARFQEEHNRGIGRFIETGEGRLLNRRIETFAIARDGGEFPIELSISAVRCSGEVIFTAFVRDITERRRSEESMKGLLQEKEVMFQEIHHRVKNNLQVVSSLISLQSDTVRNAEARSAMMESRYRIQAIARVHEQLYRSNDLSKLEFDDYLRDLAGSTLRLYSGPSPTNVQIQYELDPVRLAIAEAVPCALIVNELLINSLKYAFPEARAGIITIRLNRDPEGQTHIQVADNGIGLPDDFEWRQSATLGMELVGSLARQLRAEVRVTTKPGTSFELVFRSASETQSASPTIS